METTETSNTRHCKRRGFWALLILPVLLAGGIWATLAHADDGFGFGPGGFGGGSPEQHKAFMEKRLEKMLDHLKATDSQKTAIKAIFERMAAEMRPVHDQHSRLHAQIVTALSADTVDRVAIEELRKQIPQMVDQASQIFSKALLDASQVLTPEQRQTLVKFMQDHHGRRHHFM